MMLQRPKNWIAETLWKPRKTHSLEQLRYLHYVLQRNSTVNDGNKSLLVETLRQMAEILIWGDQNDSTVFDFFLEKNMLLFFLKFMTQNCGSYITVQLLQTLNILFENIRHETSLYFLLSNNHVNSIIVHKFDFSNEEVLAYYISFLKTLSLKLNKQTINFFFNEIKCDFPLYTEAIKFFHHSESMVRIAVRTLTLNTYKVGHTKMLEFICDKTATPYFSNLIWLIGKDAIELDDCVIQETDLFKFDKLKAAVADHLDHLHYLHDILTLKINVLNMILTDHMVNRLLIPLYIYSLPDDLSNHERVHISKLVSLFLLAQHMLIMNHSPLVNAIVDVIFNENEIRTTAYQTTTNDETKFQWSSNSSSSRAFIPPPASLESQLEAHGVTKDNYDLSSKLRTLSIDQDKLKSSAFYINDTLNEVMSNSAPSVLETVFIDEETNRASVEKLETNNEAAKKKSSFKLENTLIKANDVQKESKTKEKVEELSESKKWDITPASKKSEITSASCITPGKEKLFLKNILSSLDCSHRDDGETFFALCLLYAIMTNTGVYVSLLKDIGLASPEQSDKYNNDIMDKLLHCLELGVCDGSCMRLVTFEMCIKVIRMLVIQGDIIRITDAHFAMLQNIREETILQLRNFYKGDDLFVDTFEGQYHHLKAKPLNVEYITMDASLLLPATITPLTGIDFMKRLPCGDSEKAQRAAHVFIMMRELLLDIQKETESFLPLSKVDNPVCESQVLDLNNSDLIACTISQQGKQSIRRFLVIDTSQFILVEPDTSKLGWGVVKFVSHLQDVEANPDKDDSRSLHIVIQQPFTRRSKAGFNPLPVMTCKFVFDDYIRCMSARQRLQKRKEALKHRKMSAIASLLELPALASPVPSYYSLTTIEGQSSVWLPSSRDYKRKTNLQMVLTPSSVQKQKVLSPKHEEILQRQLKQDEDVTGWRNRTSHINKSKIPITKSPVSSEKPKHSLKGNEAVTLANLLEHKSATSELFGQAMQRRTSSLEIGEEISEDFMLATETNSNVFFPSSDLSLTKRIENDQIQTTENKTLTVNSLKLNKSNTKVEMRKYKCISAPGSPRGSRQQKFSNSSSETLSKSLPIMFLTSPSLSEHERKQSAFRARARIKSASNFSGGVKKLRR
ncbi:protein CLEC16A isoform X2 [Hydra vulgaris]|uniref:Protein CLEC16A isoform X2 n=1 Tax=Hydra vulgaris TaxID=6087 RepID=A0ABM4C9N1_HYDVU